MVISHVLLSQMIPSNPRKMPESEIPLEISYLRIVFYQIIKVSSLKEEKTVLGGDFKQKTGCGRVLNHFLVSHSFTQSHPPKLVSEAFCLHNDLHMTNWIRR